MASQPPAEGKSLPSVRRKMAGSIKGGMHSLLGRTSPAKAKASAAAPFTVTLSPTAIATARSALASSGGGKTGVSFAANTAGGVSAPATPDPSAPPPPEVVAALYGAAGSVPITSLAVLDNPVDLTFSYSQRNPYSFAARNDSTRISIASQGKATIPFPSAKANFRFRKGYTGGSVLYEVPAAKPVSASANRFTGHAAAKLAAAAAYNRYQPPPTCDGYRRRHSESFEASHWKKSQSGSAAAASATAAAPAAVKPTTSTILLSSTHAPPAPAAVAGTAAGSTRAVTPSITPGQPRPVIVQHVVPVGNVHKIDRLHRGTSRAAGGAFYTS